jgi:dTDP-4-dehydrorhamnose 3,5-epimerase
MSQRLSAEGCCRAAACVELSAEDPTAISIPHRVAHGFYFNLPSTHIYAVSHYWTLADELGCRWDDPGLEIPWTQREAQISPRDADLPSLEVLLGELKAALGGRLDARLA